MKSTFLQVVLIAIILVVTVSVFGQIGEPSTCEMNLLCWQEFQELVPNVIETVLLPVGSLEPHGVIPNGTDNLAPEAMARAIAKQVDALIAPTLNYGVTPTMVAYPGAVTISQSAYELFVEDILNSLADLDFKNIVFLHFVLLARKLQLPNQTNET